jgi:hypothetical protein
MEGKRGQLIPYDRMSPRTVPWDAGEQVAQAESERCWTGDGNDAARYLFRLGSSSELT